MTWGACWLVLGFVATFWVGANFGGWWVNRE